MFKKTVGLSLFLVLVLSVSAQAGIFQGNLTSAPTCGPGHFELGAFGTFFPKQVFGQAGGFVGLKGTIGILDWLDVGASYAIIPTNFLPDIPRNYNANTFGGELKVRLLKEDVVLPTISVFGDYYTVNAAARFSGVSGKVQMNDYGFGVIASKSLGPISPFGTIGYRFGSTQFEAAGISTDMIQLQNTIPFSAGVEFDLWIFQAIGEVLFIKDIQIYTAGLNLKI